MEQPSIFIPFAAIAEEMAIVGPPAAEPTSIERPTAIGAEGAGSPISEVIGDVPAASSALPPEPPAVSEEPKSTSAAEAPPSAPTAISHEGTQTIPPPQIFRPFIVLPPIFGFTPSPDAAPEAPEPSTSESASTTDVTAPAEEGTDSPFGNAAEREAEKAGSLFEPIATTPSESESAESTSESAIPAAEGGPALQIIASDGLLLSPTEPEEKPPSAADVASEAELAPPVPPEEPETSSGSMPVEAPATPPLGAITFLPTEEIAAPAHEPPLPAEPAALAPSTESGELKADEIPAPLLHLPRFTRESHVEVLPPPALPLQRFDQDALQAIFMTEETLDLAKISRLAAQLPGVHACVIATRDQACTGGTLPDGFDLAALLGLAPRVGEAAGRLPIGALKHFTLYGEQYSVSFFERAGLSLCAVHRPRSFVPGVREKLVAIADELSKG
jgi:hypothetical protein